MNALVGDMRARLRDALAEAAADDGVRAIAITGAGSAFCAGADIGAMTELAERGDEDTLIGFMRDGMAVVREIRSAPKPVVAVLGGAAAGAGASLAIACDVRIAADNATIGISFNRIGLHPDWGVSYLLPRLVGTGHALELTLTGRMVGAEEARQIGLVERVFPAATFIDHAGRYLVELGAKPPLALAEAKRTLRSADADALDAAMEAEIDAQLRCFRSPDLREGLAAFRDKRAPRFGAFE